LQGDIALWLLAMSGEGKVAADAAKKARVLTAQDVAAAIR
jgi:hypothetical protein